MNIFEKIGKQQKGKEGEPAYMVGEQLKDICRREPESGDLIEKDLDTITLDEVAQKLKARADELHTKQKGNCVCIMPMEAERIIREAYGLPGAAPTEAQEQQKKEDPDFLDLADFL